MKPTKYTKKPITIEAMLFDGTRECGTEIMKWISESRVASPTLSAGFSELTEYTSWVGGGYVDWKFEIETLEGTLTAEPGDYIIKGTKGEFYPCKPDIFQQTYTEQVQ